MSDWTYELLILFTDGSSITISGVKNHWGEDDVFIFEKNGRKNFLTKKSVVYFGRKFDWEAND